MPGHRRGRPCERALGDSSPQCAKPPDNAFGVMAGLVSPWEDKETGDA